MSCSVEFLPANIKVEVEPGTDLFKAAILAGIELKSTCGQKGTCGRCKVQVKAGPVDSEEHGSLSSSDREAGYTLACKTLVRGDVTIYVPKDSRLEEHRVLHDSKQGLTAREDYLEGYSNAPLCRRVQVTMDPPDLTDNAGDLTRLNMAISHAAGDVRPGEIGIGLEVLQNLAETLRKGDWKVTVTLTLVNDRWEIVAVEPGFSNKPAYGLAVDIGTTTIVVYLVDMESGEIVSHQGSYNRQASYGDDVISRMVYAAEEKDGLQTLQKAVIRTINDLIKACLQETGIAANDITCMTGAGNTTMTQLLTGVDPKYIRLEPYIPTMNQVPALRAKELGINIHPEGIVNLFPSVASYVGGDIVSGALFTRMAHQEEITLFVDIGTNGEMVLGNKDWLVSCACSAGPAFEGGGITFGTRAMNGAIERIVIDKETLECQVKTINNYPAIGICGSGLIDTLAKLREVGVIDRTGKFQTDIASPRIRENDEGYEYVLVWARDAGDNQDIVFTEADARNLIRAKGAVYAGIRSLLSMMQLDESVISRIIIAGGFGNFLNIKDAIRIGLLPDVEFEKYQFIGNSSVKGAYLALMARDAWEEARTLGQMITYMELSAGTTFMDEYVSALFLPHTDLKLFPSVEAEDGVES